MSKNIDNLVYVAWWVWIVDAIGDWNPQLLRELKSRVNWRNIIVTGLLSIGIQVSFLAYRSTLLPVDRVTDRRVYHEYCQINSDAGCAADALGNPLINWQEWWAHVAMGSGVIFVLMATVGAYFVASSFRQERELGTLDFLRLVPRSSATVLVGKLLGVPVLVYLAGICVLPLQLYAVHAAQISILTVLTWDLAMVGLTVMCYLSAALVTLRSHIIPIVLAIITSISSGVLVAISSRWYGDYYKESTLQWYGILLGNQPLTFLVLSTLTCWGIYWLYRALERSYQQPNSPILSRTQSYLWSLNYHLFLLGFCVIYKRHNYLPLFNISNGKFTHRLAFDLSLNAYSGGGSYDSIFGNLPPMFWSLLLFWLLLTISLMLPNVRSMAEWAQEQDLKPDWWKTMLWDDRSPAILAALVNIGIAIAVWSIPVAIAFPISRSSIVTWLLASTIALIFAGIWSTIAHFRLFGRVSKYRLLMVGVASIFILPAYIWETNARGKNIGEWFGLFPSTFGRMLLSAIESNPWGSIIVILGMLWIWIWLLLCLQTKLAQLGRT
jgi:ABC-type transport system involved in cytochrome c biogenesis permease component